MSADRWSMCPRCVARDDVGLRGEEFREDFEVGQDDGVVTVNYRGECQRCSLLIEFKDERPIPGLDEVQVREHNLTWGTTPAGFEVLAPNGQWYRIVKTRYSKHTGMQMVTMLGKEWSRLPGDPVTARGYNPAVEALGFPEVLEDEA